MKISFRHFLTAVAFLATLGLADGPVEAQNFKFKSAGDAPAAAGAADVSGEDGAEEAAAGPVQVGNAARVTRLVKGYLEEEDEEREIEMMADVYQNEIIETGVKSAIDIRFLDNTRLTLGPNSTMVLDQFVFDPRPGKGKLVINATKGVLRFVSGKLSSSAYTIKTPVATMGVRGTEFTVIVAEDGGTTVVVSDGVVSVANLAGDEVSVKAGLSTNVRPQKEGDKAPPPPELPAPAPPEVFELIGEMDLALEEAEEASEEELAEAEEEAAEEEDLSEEDREEIQDDANLVADMELIPQDVLDGLIDGTPEGLLALEDYLIAAGLDAETITGRAISVLDALRYTGTTNAQEMMEMVDRILSLAAQYYQGADISLFKHEVLESMLMGYVAEMLSSLETAAGDDFFSGEAQDSDIAFESEVGASPN